ncbi:hypothetical protein [Glaciecola sp. HTCC2999]|jgi:hypothetical protein|uniref:hypothetical protein n=1 Tax=Glaciecola sp. HTCC2999 TaxID=455436 RepID=UPI0000E0F9E9|nr:hypothetical protein [Glaciecola sp. HTCC2999]
MTSTQALHQIYAIDTLQYGIKQHSVEKKQAKWQYLLSDTICFGRDIESGIRIQKPEKAKVFAWVMRIVSQGQCESIYIENHEFSNMQTALLQQAAQRFEVNVTVLNTVSNTNNVVVGPW